MIHQESSNLKVDLSHMDLMGHEDFDTLRNFIQEMYFDLRTTLEEALKNLVVEIYKSGKINEEVLRSLNKKDFYLEFETLKDVMSIRHLRISSNHRKLISVTGTVTKCTDVRPELLIGRFLCKKCGNLVDDVDQQFSYQTPKKCNHEKCDNRTNFELDEFKSKFGDWQKLKLQENANEIPPGAMPRSMDVILKNFCVDKVKPGDKIILTGSLIVVPETSKLLKPGLKVYKEKQ